MTSGLTNGSSDDSLFILVVPNKKAKEMPMIPNPVKYINYSNFDDNHSRLLQCGRRSQLHNV